MANVKVHLKEIIKYVLLPGMGIQMILGAVICVLWLSNADSFTAVLRALLGVVSCCGLSYVFLRLWRRKWPKWMCFFGALGTVGTPIVLQTCLEAGKEYVLVLLLGAVFICFFLAKEKLVKRIAKVGAFIVALVAVVVICNAGAEAPSFAARMASRFCYPGLYSGALKTPQELQDKVGYLELRESLRSADGINTILYPSLMEKYGNKAEADAVCYELAIYGFNNNTKSVLMNIIWDFAGYNSPMLVSELQMQGMAYDAVTGHNYGELVDKTGAFSTLYWRYSVVWYVLASVLTILSGLMKKGKFTSNGGYTIILFEAAALCFVMQGAGFFDYKNLPIVHLIWMGYVLNGLRNVIDSKEE